MRLKDKLWMLKIRFLLWSINTKTNYYKRKYCARGLHKLTSSILEVSGSNMKTKKVQYLRCKYCRWRFFTTMYQRNKYLKMTYPKYGLKKLSGSISQLMSNSLTSKSIHKGGKKK